ncbi:MAG: glucosyl-3-phosphoglycerate synthase [Thermoleophilia bacterium]
MNRERWLRRRTFRGAAMDVRALRARKRALGATVSVVLPALDVAATVGPIVERIRDALCGPLDLVDEVVVVDSGSADDSAAVAARAGARVVAARDVLAHLGPARGKGEAMWKGLAVAEGDIVAFVDADIVGFDPAFVTGLVGPLLLVPDIAYVKGFYRRNLHGRRDDGGRVTEICARPLVNLLYPELAGFVQPLAGEAAGRRDLLRALAFPTGYAVELDLLVEIWRRAGLAALAQVDLGERRHRHQPTAVLGRMAHEITATLLDRLAGEGRGVARADDLYARPVRAGADLVLARRRADLGRRPPLNAVTPAPAAAP